MEKTKKDEILKKLKEAKEEADEVAYESERCHHKGCFIGNTLDEVIEEIKSL